MSTAEIIPCIWLDDKASQAAEFYINLFPDSRIIARSCYPHSFDNPGNKPRGSILTVEIEIAGRRFTLLNGGPLFVLNTSISFFVNVETPEEADRLYEGLGACRTYVSRLDFCPFLFRSKPPACSFRAAFVRFRRPPWRLFFAIAQRSLREASLRLASPLPRCQNAHVAQLRSAFAALYRKKIIKNRLEALKSDRLLAVGGEVIMPIGSYSWSKRYGWIKDKFGVSWQIITGRREQGPEVIAPCLMFQEANKGKTEEAMRFYTDCFANGRIEHIEHYLGGEGPIGYVKHGRFTLGRQTMFAMDSPFDYGFNFNEAISLQVMCSNQKELDSYWEALADGGEHSPCGWLKDRFGISWQVVPAALITWMQNTDSNAWDRAFEAMMSMQKLDIETLESLFSF